MDVIRPSYNTPVRLIFNYPDRNNPYRRHRLRLSSANTKRIPLRPAVTLSGFVKDINGTALPNRTVRVFGDQGMNQFLGNTYSGDDGSFSIQVVGGPGSRFVCTVQGEDGENMAVFTRISE